MGNKERLTGNDDAYRRARKKVNAKMGFYSHLIVYIIVNSILYFIYYSTTPGGYPWFLWPLLGWGIGLLFNFLGVFVFSGSFKERMIQKEMEKQKPGG